MRWVKGDWHKNFGLIKAYKVFRIVGVFTDMWFRNTDMWYCERCPLYARGSLNELTVWPMYDGYSIPQINKGFCLVLHSKSKISSPSTLPLALIYFSYYIQGTTNHISKHLVKTILKLFLNPIKFLNNYLELWTINLTLWLRKEFTKYLCGKSYISQIKTSFNYVFMIDNLSHTNISNKHL